MDIVTIPQYRNTCWFNAILTSLLYSQYSRELINIKKQSWENNDFTILLKIILEDYYIKDKNKNYFLFFYINNPQKILKTLYDEYNIKKKDINIPYFNPIKSDISINFYAVNNTINYTLYLNKILNISTIAFVINKGKLYYSYYNFDNINRKILKYNSKITGTTTTKTSLIKKLKKDYDTIIIELDNYDRSTFLIDDSYTNKNTIDDLLNLEYIIFFNNNLYILDSILFSSKNDKKTGHVIAGITHSFNKYIYNSSSIHEVVFNINDKSHAVKFKTSCDLINYNWYDKNNFFKTDKCNIKSSNIEFVDRCYSINNRNNIYKYIRLNDNNISDLLINKPELSSKINELQKLINPSLQSSVGPYISPIMNIDSPSSPIKNFNISPIYNYKFNAINSNIFNNTKIYELENIKQYIQYNIDSQLSNGLILSDYFKKKSLPPSQSVPQSIPQSIPPSQSQKHKLSPNSTSPNKSPYKKKLRSYRDSSDKKKIKRIESDSPEY